MKAMVLAAGEGTRLRPLTLTLPKVLLPAGGVPVIEHTLRWLKSHGITAVAINLLHHGDKIRQFVGDGSRFGLKIVYSPEEVLYGTAGAVKRLGSFFDSTFVVVYGDVLTDLDLDAMLSYHRQKKAVATLALLEVPNPWEVGIVEIDGAGRLRSLVEKPPKGSESGNLANGGVYILESEIFDYIPGKGPCDFGYDVFPKLIKLGLPVFGYRLNGADYLVDMGTPEKYRRADRDIAAGKLKIRHGK